MEEVAHEATEEFPVEDSCELSPLQEGMLIHTLRDIGVGMYVAQAIYTLNGVDTDAFGRAWQHLVNRYAILRTSFAWEGLESPVQRVHADMTVELQLFDWRDVTSQVERESRFKEFLKADREQGFDLNVPPLMRVFLIRITDERWFFVFTHHHVLLDGLSSPIILQDLFRFYKAELNSQPLRLPPPRPFRHYIEWLRQQDIGQAESYWRNYMEGITSPTPLPGDLGVRRRIASRVHFGKWEAKLDAKLLQNLQRLSRGCHVSLNIPLLAAWAILLSRYSRQTDVVFGLLFNGRPSSLKGVESMVGMFLNTLPCRMHVDENAPMDEWLVGLQEQQFELQEYEWSSLRHIQEWSELKPGVPLFESVIDNKAGLRPRDADQSKENKSAFAQKGDTQFATQSVPLHLNIEAPYGELIVTLTYDARRFEHEAVVRLSEQYCTLLREMTENPQGTLSELSIMSAKELNQVLFDWNQTDRPFPEDQVLHQLFEQQVARTPDAPAVRFKEGALTYTELDEQSNALANYMRESGVQPGMIVGLCVRRSLEMATALLAILKSGAAYVPLDPAFPQARLRFIMEDADVELLVAEATTLEKLPGFAGQSVCIDRDRAEWEASSIEPLENIATADDLAYVLYTSGSTGQPKGVEIPHRVPVARLYAEADTFGADEALCAKTTLGFVDSVWELFSAWRHGLCVTLVPEDDVKNPVALIENLARAEATRLVLVPSLLREILNSGVDLEKELPHLRHWISSGEKLPADLCKQFAEALPDGVLTNLYGTTEVWDVTRSDSRDHPAGELLPIGRPLPNVRVYVLDEKMRPVPIGLPGELYVGGAYLARGYRKLPDKTAESFVPDPFGEEGDKLYRTGDLVRWRASGEIEYLGRLDQQIKMRGFRIEVDEIEAALRMHEDVHQVAVAVTDDDILYACVVPVKDVNFQDKELKAFLSGQLPAHMIPVFYKQLDELPLTPSGKIDRRSLPALELEDRQAASTDLPGEAVGLATETEETIAAVWSDMLRVSGINRSSHFFEVGGHSLMAMRMAMRLSKEVEFQVPLGRFFELPVLSDLAAWIDRARSGEDTEAEQIPELERAERGKEAPVSFAQQGLWVVEQLNPGSVSYTVPNFIVFRGEFDLEAMRSALSDLVQRHESLRTTFMSRDGVPYQVIHSELPINLPLVDLTTLAEGEREANARQLLREQARQPWDLVNGPLFRTKVLKLASDRHAFLLTKHHIITDGNSVGIFTRELSVLYKAAQEGTVAQLPELAVQYPDFALWQRDWMKGELLEKQLDYWREKLGGAARLDLPTDRPRPLAPRYQGSQHHFKISQPVMKALANLAGAEDASFYMALLAVFKIFLARYAGHEDISVGTPSTNRNRPELQAVIGYFVNVLVMRTEVSENPSFRELLKRVRTTCVEAYNHQDVPFEKLVEELNPQRDTSGQPLFQAMFVHEVVNSAGSGLPGVDVEHKSAEMETANFDLVLSARESDVETDCTLQYNADLFEPETVERMCRHMELLFERVAADPEQPLSGISMLSDEERHQVLVEWNDTDTDNGPDCCIHELIAEQAAADPQALALWYQDNELTRGELDQRANRLASRLHDLGCEPDSIVGLCIPRSFELIVGALGILKSGSAFLPLDPDYPSDRLEYMITDSQVSHIVSTQELTELLQDAGGGDKLVFLDDESESSNVEAAPASCPDSGVSPSNLAYIIYTSGSTGTPKGVEVEHQNLVAVTRAQNPTFRIDPDSRVIQMLSISFDAGVGEIFRALTGGAALFLADKQDLLPGQELVELLQDLHITHAAIPPAVLAVMPAGAEKELPELAVLTTAGEAFSPEMAQRWGSGRHIITGHGATETAVGDTIAIDWDLTRKPPLGVPLPNMKAYVLDQWGEPVPINTPGELYISGPQVARGYLRNPEMTAQRFLSDPFSDQPDTRMYRTGDMVRWLGSGDLDFIGRADQQVKIRGYRIELGEIEAVLEKHPRVGRCVVDVTDEGGVKRLVCYYVAAQKTDLEVADLEIADIRAFLKEHLPAHMIPAFYMELPEIPLTANNKVDRRSLPVPDIASLTMQAAYVAPRTNTEETLAGIWSKVLGLERVSVEDNFFELGGDSILSIQVVGQASKAGLMFTAQDLFQNQSVAALAEKVESGTLAIDAEQGIVSGEFPVTPTQAWFLEPDPPEPHHFNHWHTHIIPGKHSPDHIRQALGAVMNQHDALRLRCERTADGWRQYIAEPEEEVPFEYFDLSDLPPEEQDQQVEEITLRLNSTLDLVNGPIVRVGWLYLGEGRGNRMDWAVHHNAIDPYCWPFLKEDFFSAYQQVRSGQQIQLPPKTTSFKQWGETLARLAASDEIQGEIPYWLDERRKAVQPLPRDFPDGGYLKTSTDHISIMLDNACTERLLRSTVSKLGVKIVDILLTALGSAFCHWAERDQVLIDMEGHGREDIEGETNLSRTVGWFSNLYPALLEIDVSGPVESNLTSVRDQLDSIPNRRMGYFLLRYLAPDPEIRAQLAALPAGEIAFNYLGQHMSEQKPGEGSDERVTRTVMSESTLGNMRHPIEVVASVVSGEGLTTRFAYSRDQYNAATIEKIATKYYQVLRAIAIASAGENERQSLEQDIPEVPDFGGYVTF